MNNESKALKILAFSGSLKAESLNQKLVREAAAIAADRGADVTVISLRDYPLPLFNEELEQEDIPEVTALRELFSQADALLIASPEYNGSLTAALKNAIDWVSRPNPDSAYQPHFSRQSAAIIATSPGALGGLRGLNHLREILSNLGTLVMPAPLAVPKAYEAINGEGQLVDSALKQRLTAQLEQLLTIKRL